MAYLKNTTVEQVKSFIRQPYAWPGGYPLILVMNDGECLCADCARSSFRAIVNSTKHRVRDGWDAAGVEVFWEGPVMYCAHCNASIESAYGDPQEEE